MAKRRTVFFLLPTLGGGGAERVVTTLIRHIDQTRFRLVLGVVDSSNERFRDHLPPDLQLIEFRRQRVRQAILPILRTLWRLRPHLVFTTLDHLNTIMAATKPLWPPGVKHVVRATSNGSLDTSRARGAQAVAYRSADLVVYQSIAMRDLYESALKLSRVRSAVINNPVDIAQIRSAAAEPLETGYDPAAFNFVVVGRVDPVKGFDIAINALAELGRRDVTLTLLGEGNAELTDELKMLVTRRNLGDRVRLLGFQANPYPYIAAADAVVLPSRSEGFPNIVLEALALQRPVVATPVPGMSSFLQDVPGSSVATEITPEALSRAMATALQHRGQTPCVDQVERFAAPNVAADYTDAFERVLGGRSAG